MSWYFLHNVTLWNKIIKKLIEYKLNINVSTFAQGCSYVHSNYHVTITLSIEILKKNIQSD